MKAPHPYLNCEHIRQRILGQKEESFSEFRLPGFHDRIRCSLLQRLHKQFALRTWRWIFGTSLQDWTRL